jgi:hypothetical protein
MSDASWERSKIGILSKEYHDTHAFIIPKLALHGIPC